MTQVQIKAKDETLRMHIGRSLRAALLPVLLLGITASAASAATASDMMRWGAEAARVTIVRDDWGIAHVHGKSDADAVFGMIYAQAEDDFNRVEYNYLMALGRVAEAEGESALYDDLRMKLFIDPVDLHAQYAGSPPLLKTLTNAWADGLNYYLAVHPNVHPRVIRRFEPWMALSFTEGSIGGDITRISTEGIAAFYGGVRTAAVEPNDFTARFPEPTGSNGIAIAPTNTLAHHALLLINPHTSFYFRSELQMTSDAGLNAYGAVTWGQFFIYQGFNEHAGWMHTSSGVDTVDFFAETIIHRGGKLFYRYGREQRRVLVARIAVPYRTTNGALAYKTFTSYRTHHGPVVRSEGDKWISVALMQKPVAALSQSYLRTKAVDYATFRRVAELRANSSNNTIFADAKGEIAYLHPQFIPRRDDRFDYTQPVEGSDPQTDWHGLHALDEAPHLLDPPNGWIANSNNWPYSAAGPNSPKVENFPRYMDTVGENARGVHDTLLLSGRTDFTLDGLIATAYDSYLPAFADLVPKLVTAYDALLGTDARKAKLAEPIAMLRNWDDRWSAISIPTAVAVFFGEALGNSVDTHVPGSRAKIYDAMRAATPDQLVDALVTGTDKLTTDFGTWRTPWGEINRFQRIDDAIAQRFDDAGPSIPVPFTSSLWGSLASFGTSASRTKKHYGTSGNSFVAVVEFGPKIRAKAITAGGESGNPKSRHFADEALRYSAGELRDVYFYPEQLVGHTERTYHP